MGLGRGITVLTAALALTLAAGPACADSWVTAFRGHLSFGYAKLFVTDAPGGSLSFSAGVDHPMGSTVRGGIDIDYNLLGTRTVPRGSLVADVDYSSIEVLAMVHWQPSWGIPIGRLSAGTGVMGARAAVSSSGAAEFQDLPVDEVVPVFAAEATLINRSASPVRVGLETGVHVGLVSDNSWTVWDVRLAIHY
ncbi:MAG: hypothetical protein ACHQ52_05625 [Candidatus Eisenbacteria bacterium]